MLNKNLPQHQKFANIHTEYSAGISYSRKIG